MLAAAAVVAVFLSASAAPTAAARKALSTIPAAATTPAATRPASPSPSPHRLLTLSGPVVALGDSYTAGDLMPLSLTSQPPGCLRSPNAYPVQVARALGATADFIDAACTNAGVKEMTSAQKTYLGTNPPQLSVLTPSDSLVMLTLGGDDIGFFNVLDTCMELSITDPDGSPCERHYTSGGTDQLAAKVAAEGPKITAVLEAIRTLAPRARVLLVGYPDLFPLHGGCWPAVPITNGDIAYLLGIEMRVNAMLSAAAKAAGATYVNTFTATIGHDVCQSAKVKDVEGLVPTSLAAPFHMNTRGQDAVAALVLAALRRDGYAVR